MKKTEDIPELDGLPKGVHSLNYSEEVHLMGIEKSPVAIIREKDLYYTILGKYRLSQQMNTIEEAYEDAIRTDMNRMIAIMSCVAKITLDDKKLIENIEVKI